MATCSNNNDNSYNNNSKIEEDNDDEDLIKINLLNNNNNNNYNESGCDDEEEEDEDEDEEEEEEEEDIKQEIINDDEYEDEYEEDDDDDDEEEEEDEDEDEDDEEEGEKIEQNKINFDILQFDEDNNNNEQKIKQISNSSLMKKISPLEWVGHKVRRKAIKRHHLVNVNSYKRSHKIDWTVYLSPAHSLITNYLYLKENAKLGTHSFYDLPSTTNYSCYLNDQDALVNFIFKRRLHVKEILIFFLFL